MSQTLNIDGVRFESSASMAQRFSYTQDYVGRLAREGRVSGIKVGRLWFVEATSFEQFIKVTEQEKKQRAEALRAERRAERIASASTASSEDQTFVLPETFIPKSVTIVPDHRLALAQTTAVVCCGLFVGLIGWFGASADVHLAELQQGGAAILEQVGGVFTQALPEVTPEATEQVAATYGSSAVVSEEPVVFAELPQVTYLRTDVSAHGTQVDARTDTVLSQVDVSNVVNDEQR